jgi:hypothetical protein
MTATIRGQEIIAKLASVSAKDRELVIRLVHLCSNASRPVQAYVTAMLNAPPELTSIEDVRDRAGAVIAYLEEQN